MNLRDYPQQHGLATVRPGAMRDVPTATLRTRLAEAEAAGLRVVAHSIRQELERR